MTSDRARYIKMNGHLGFYQNAVSKRIRYIKVHNGITVRLSTKATKITDAKKIVDEYLINLFSENPKKDLLKKKGIQNPLISKIWKELVESRSVSRQETTIEGYDVSWRIGIEPFWGKKTVLELNPRVMSEYEKWYLQKHKERVFFNTGKHLAMLIRYCHQNGYIQKIVPVPDIDLTINTRTQKEKVGRVYTDAEYKACIARAFNPLIKVALTCYRHLGMRKMELLSSKIEHWDLKNKTLKLWSAKNKKWRTVVIPDVVLAAINEWLEIRQDSVWMFPSTTNPEKHVVSQVFDEQWTKTKIAAEIENADVENAARIHDWRHTFATMTARDGWPPIAACYVLDMSLQEYQNTYTHVSMKDIMKLMIKSFGGQK